MNELFLARIFAYSLLPLLLATAHILLSKQARTMGRRVEIFMMYLLAISVGANGLGGAFGHLFLSDLVAEGIGWSTGSPFQLEMGYANLLIGVLGLMAVGRRDGFRTAAIIATTILGFGATLVHLQDIAAHGNLAPGNTVQNISNLLDPILLIGLSWWSAHRFGAEGETAAFHQWQMRQQPIPGLAAAGIGMGFGLGYAVGGLFIWTIFGAFAGVAIGLLLSKQAARTAPNMAIEQ